MKSLRESALDLLCTVTFNATVVKDNFKTETRDHDVYAWLDNAEVELPTVTFNAIVVKDNFETKARGHAVFGSLDNAEAELQAEADAIHAHSALLVECDILSENYKLFHVY